MSAQQPIEKQNKIFFSEFCFDHQTRTLCHGQKIVNLPPKPSEILALLLGSHQQLVTRETIIQKVWPNQIVDFDQNINFAIKQIRAALGDDSKTPQFIETIPKKGYRFISEVNANPLSASDSVASVKTEHHSPQLTTESQPLHPVQSERKVESALTKSRFNTWATATVTLLLLISITIYSIWEHVDSPVSEAHVGKSANANPELEQILKRAFYLYEQSGAENLKRSQSLFEQVVKTDPNNGQAYAGLALVKMFSGAAVSSANELRRLVSKALELAPELSYSNLAKAYLSLYGDWQIPEAHYYFEQAVKANPQNIAALHDLAVVAAIQGEFELAQDAVERALAIDPGRFQEHYHAGWFYQVTKRYDLALKQCIQSLEILPTHQYSLLCAGRSAFKLELTQTAHFYLTELMRQLNTTEPQISQVGQAIERGEIEQFNQWYVTWLTENQSDPFSLALAYAEMGDIENALASLKTAIQQKNLMVPTAWAFDEMSNLRDDARFVQLMNPVKRY